MTPMPAAPAPSFSTKVAALRRAIPFDPSAYRPENDPQGNRAHALVAGMYEALRKEAGFDEAAACGFLQGLAELGWGGTVPAGFAKRATFWGGVAALPGNVASAALLAPRMAAHAVGGFMDPGTAPGQPPGASPSFMDRIGGAQRGGMAPVAYDAGKALPSMRDGLSPGENFSAYANAAGRAIQHPVTFAQGGAIATSSPEMAAAADHLVKGDNAAALGDVVGNAWEHQLKPWLHDHLGGIGDSLGQAGDAIGHQLTPENLKKWAPWVAAGLGTFATGKLMGLGTGTSAALGVAGGYGLPKLYQGLSAMAGPHGVPQVTASGSAAPAATPNAAPVKTDAQVKTDQSAATVNQIANQARQ